MTGMDLKIDRIRQRVTARAVAREMGVSYQRVAQIEGAASVTAAITNRYQQALRQLAKPVETGQVA